MKKVFIGIMALGVCLAIFGTASAATYTLTWSAVTQYTNGTTISGSSVTYSAYWSTSSSMSSPKTVVTGVTGTSTSFDPATLGMTAGSTVYFAVKATASGSESAFSSAKSWSVPAITLSSIAINGATSVNEGATSSYTATATWSDGSTSTVSPTWTVSSTTYASINSSGVLTAKSVNSDQTVTVNASYASGGVTKTATRNVTIKNVAATLSSIEITGAFSVNEGATSSYQTLAHWSDGTSSTITPTWTLSSTTYASMSSAGVLTAKSVNSDQTVKITASYTSSGVTKTDSMTVTIKNVVATLSSIAINGATSVNEGATSSYTATATWSDGTTTTVTPTWTLSSTTYATISSAGVLTTKTVTANQAVTVNASYASGGVTKTATRSVSINKATAKLSHIWVSGAASVNEGSSATYSAYAQWTDGTSSVVTATWNISSTTYASITSAGVLTAKSVSSDQTVRITASFTSGGATENASMNVTINKAAAATLSSIAINGATSVNEGETSTYTATATWSDGSTSTVTPSWTVSSTTYATINASSGVLTAKTVTADQTVTVNASYTSASVTKTATRNVTIKNVAATLSSIAINGATSVNEGETSTYTATATWSDGTTSTVTPSWTVSSTTYATINASSGVLTTKTVTQDRSVTVNASYTNGGVTKTATRNVTIKHVAVTLSSIAISGATTVNEGDTSTYTATATWSDGSTTTVTPNWTVSSTTYATINASSGVLTAKTVTQDRSVTVNASYTNGGVTKTATRNVTIKHVVATLSSIAISGATTVNEGETSTYTATATWSDGTTTTVTPNWTVSSTTYATINASSGVLTAKTVTQDRSVTVNASYTNGGVTKTATRNVTIKHVAVTLSSIAISGATSVNEGTTSTYTATATWSDGTTTTVTPSWTVSNTTYATINASSGVLTAKTVTQDRSVTVNASYTNGGVTKTATRNVTIKHVAATLSSIAINGATSVNEGTTSTYTATATWSDGTTSTVTPSWTVSSTTYASINSSGVLTAKTVTQDRSVTVNASYTSGSVSRTATRNVTIKHVAATLSSIAINGATSVNEGTTSTYTATATWSDGTTSTVTPTWSLSSSTYASINSSGVLTAKTVSSNQTVTVNASYTSGSVSRTATRTVTINKASTAKLSHIWVSGASSVNGGATATYTAYAQWVDGTSSVVTATWTILSTTYATITTAGVLTAKTVSSDQTVRITASYTSGGVTENASTNVTIKKASAQSTTAAAPDKPRINKPDSLPEEIWRIEWNLVETYADGSLLPAGAVVTYYVYWTPDPYLKDLELLSSTTGDYLDFNPYLVGMAPEWERQNVYFLVQAILDGEKSSYSSYLTWKVLNRQPSAPTPKSTTVEKQIR